jgi:hypothetical protein
VNTINAINQKTRSGLLLQVKKKTIVDINAKIAKMIFIA